MKLNFDYFIGRVFNLDQKTMNKMIDDVHKLQEENMKLKLIVEEMEAKKRLSDLARKWFD